MTLLKGSCYNSKDEADTYYCCLCKSLVCLLCVYSPLLMTRRWNFPVLQRTTNMELLLSNSSGSWRCCSCVTLGSGCSVTHWFISSVKGEIFDTFGRKQDPRADPRLLAAHRPKHPPFLQIHSHAKVQLRPPVPTFSGGDFRVNCECLNGYGVKKIPIRLWG